MNAHRAQDEPGRTLGAELERMRLQLRARQLERALRRLRHRAQDAKAGSTQSAGLNRCVADFEEALERVRQRLGDRPVCPEPTSDRHGQRVSAPGQRAPGG